MKLEDMLLIDTLFDDECRSLSGRRELTYSVGRHRYDRMLYVLISGSTGAGTWISKWVSARDIETIVRGSQALLAKSLHPLYQGTSNNTAGFLLAVLLHLGLVRRKEGCKYLIEHVPGTRLEQVVMAKAPFKPRLPIPAYP